MRELNSASENPADRRRRAADLAQRELPHRLSLAGTGLAARGGVPDRCPVGGPARRAAWTTANTGLTPFLAMDIPPSSGLMIVEYSAHSALGDMRRLAAPVVLGGAVLSVGAEEHAGFGAQAAWSATETVRAYRVVLACELVAARPGAAAARDPPGRPRARASLRPC